MFNQSQSMHNIEESIWLIVNDTVPVPQPDENTEHEK